MTEVALRASEGVDRRRESATPRAGRPFTTEAAQWNSAVLHAEVLIRADLDGAIPAAPLADPAQWATGAVQFPCALDRAARRLTASWLIAVLAGNLHSDSSLLDAEAWFTGSRRTASTLSLDAARHALDVLRDVAQSDSAWAMLPYALDPTPHEYRRDVVGKGTSGAHRSNRKASGSFFTPSDVADHITELALNEPPQRLAGLRVLDPAVGTGVFLRAVFTQLVDNGIDRDTAVRSLYGIDVDERCVDMTAFVLLLDYLLAGPPLAGPVYDTWLRIRSNLLAADSLRVLSGLPSSASLFEQPASSELDVFTAPFDVVLGNPPYARLGARPDSPELRSRFRTLEDATPSSDIYPAFVELLCSALGPHGTGAFVVPMSIGYSSTRQLRQLRTAAEHSGGAWSFEFFDRTPDALFGDDVKQRTAIVKRHAGAPYSITTGPVMRWTSRTRSTLFHRIPQIELGSRSIRDGVPKVGSPTQAAALDALGSLGTRLEHDLADCARVKPPIGPDGDRTVYVAGTAYNWLNVYRTGASITNGVEKPTASPFTALTTMATDDADALFALLSSRVTYWLWRVETDAFHVSSGWTKSLPLSPGLFNDHDRSRLAELGRALWGEIEDHPVRSVNGGSATVSYCPHAASSLLDEIDEKIIDRSGIDHDFGDELAAFIRDLVVVGRDQASEHGLRRALAAWRED